MDELECELREALKRQPAPSSLKRKVMNRRSVTQRRHVRMVWFERIAAALILVAVAGAGVLWRHQDEQRRGEEAKQQVFTALRITGHALNHMNQQLAAHRRAAQE